MYLLPEWLCHAPSNAGSELQNPVQQKVLAKALEIV